MRYGFNFHRLFKKIQLFGLVNIAVPPFSRGPELAEDLILSFAHLDTRSPSISTRGLSHDGTYPSPRRALMGTEIRSRHRFAYRQASHPLPLVQRNETGC